MKKRFVLLAVIALLITLAAPTIMEGEIDPPPWDPKP
jgi:hypothetical protein